MLHPVTIQNHSFEDGSGSGAADHWTGCINRNTLLAGNPDSTDYEMSTLGTLDYHKQTLAYTLQDDTDYSFTVTLDLGSNGGQGNGSRDILFELHGASSGLLGSETKTIAVLNGAWTADQVFLPIEIMGSSVTDGEALMIQFKSLADNNWVQSDNIRLDVVATPVGGDLVVPEPASIAIWSFLGLCLAGYGYRRRRRNS